MYVEMLQLVYSMELEDPMLISSGEVAVILTMELNCEYSAVVGYESFVFARIACSYGLKAFRNGCHEVLMMLTEVKLRMIR